MLKKKKTRIYATPAVKGLTIAPGPPVEAAGPLFDWPEVQVYLFFPFNPFTGGAAYIRVFIFLLTH